METHQFEKYLSKIRNACKKRSLKRWDESSDICVYAEPPASQEEITAIEDKLGTIIPVSFRQILANFSRKLTVDWVLGDEAYKKIDQGQFRKFWHGELYWSLEDLPELQKKLIQWQTDCYDDPNDDYGCHWYHKFIVCEVEQDDFIAIELQNPGKGNIVYLDHEGDYDTNGLVLAKNFETFVEHSLQLGCPTWEAMLAFMENGKSGLQSNCPNAKLWRKWFGLD